MGLADNFLRQIETLEKALAAKRSGLPERLIVLMYSNNPKDIYEATDATLARYSVTREIAEAAGSKIYAVTLPWAAGRKIGISTRDDDRVMADLRRPSMTGVVGL